MPNTTIVRIDLEQTSTRAYVTEHATFSIEYFEPEKPTLSYKGYAKYKWQNRPWQKYDYNSALVNAIKDTGIFTLEFLTKVSEANSVESVVQLFSNRFNNCVVYLNGQPQSKG